MSAMRLSVVGCGDAFGTGGRFQTCFLVDTPDGTVMLDCGATTATALAQFGRSANTIPTVIISHLHGDHFAGLTFLVVDGVFGTRRTIPLTVFGPTGVEARFRAATDAMFPGFLRLALPFDLRFIEMRAGQTVQSGPLDALAFEVDHPSGSPAHGLRLSYGGRVLAFTGDSRWSDVLIPLGRGADLYIMECYAFAATPAAHLTWKQIEANLDAIGARRVLLTHMNAEMLSRRNEVQDPRVVAADDGMVLDV